MPAPTDSGTYIHVGPEIGVASTKAFTGQVTVLVMMAMMIARLKGRIDTERYESVLRGLLAMPEKIKEILSQADRIKEVAAIYTYARNFLYLGRGCNYPTAMEGALKLKEISYIHAEGCPAAEMKHGTIALIDHEMPTVVIATNGSIYEKTISNIQEIKARGRQGDRRGDRGRHDRLPHGRPLHLGSGDGRVPHPAAFLHPAAAVRLLHRREQGPRRGPAAQPGQIGNGRITLRAAPPRSCGHPNDIMAEQTTIPPHETAALVAVVRDRQEMRQCEEYLDELAFLAETAGIVTIKRFIQRLPAPSARTYVGPGKLEEIAAWAEENNVDVVIFDDELSPSQTRNIEKALGRRITDRTRLILDIFVQRAQTAYAKTQVQLAQYEYMLPRLTGLWTHLERQRGGTGTRGGSR